MSWLGRLLHRGPSQQLREAQVFHESIVAQREEVDKLTISLRDGIRKPNHLAPLLEQILRSTR